MAELIDLKGRRFGKWLVIYKAEGNYFGSAQWLCRCDCGKRKVIPTTRLRSGRTKKCHDCYMKGKPELLDQQILLNVKKSWFGFIIEAAQRQDVSRSHLIREALKEKYGELT